MSDSEVRVEERPAATFIGIRHIGPYWKIGETFGRLGQWMKENSCECGPGVGIFYDDPTSVPEGELRSDAACFVSGDIAVNGDVKLGTLAGGKFAVMRHVGDYSTLPKTWELFWEKITEEGHKMDARPSFEIYLGFMGSVPNDQLRTDLYMPIQ